jgi:hypothetical protein
MELVSPFFEAAARDRGERPRSIRTRSLSASLQTAQKELFASIVQLKPGL